MSLHEVGFSEMSFKGYVKRKALQPTGRIKYKHYPQPDGTVTHALFIEVHWFFIFTRWIYSERLIEMDNLYTDTIHECKGASDGM